MFSLSKLARPLSILVIGISLVWGGLSYSQHRSQKQIDLLQAAIEDLKKQNVKLEGQRNDWKAKAAKSEEQASQFLNEAKAAKIVADKASVQVKILKAKLKTLPQSKPQTKPDSLPSDKDGLTAAFTKEGFYPFPIIEPAIAFKFDDSRQILALVKDGKEYPGALSQISVLTETVDELTNETQAKDLQNKNLESAYLAEKSAALQFQGAVVTCEKELENQKQITQNVDLQKSEVENQLRKEKPKKFLGLGLGVVIGLVLTLL